jgi:hypothetical protein
MQDNNYDCGVYVCQYAISIIQFFNNYSGRYENLRANIDSSIEMRFGAMQITLLRKEIHHTIVDLQKEYNAHLKINEIATSAIRKIDVVHSECSSEYSQITDATSNIPILDNRIKRSINSIIGINLQKKRKQLKVGQCKECFVVENNNIKENKCISTKTKTVQVKCNVNNKIIWCIRNIVFDSDFIKKIEYKVDNEDTIINLVSPNKKGIVPLELVEGRTNLFESASTTALFTSSPEETVTRIGIPTMKTITKAISSLDASTTALLKSSPVETVTQRAIIPVDTPISPIANIVEIVKTYPTMKITGMGNSTNYTETEDTKIPHVITMNNTTALPSIASQSELNASSGIEELLAPTASNRMAALVAVATTRTPLEETTISKSISTTITKAISTSIPSIPEKTIMQINKLMNKYTNYEVKSCRTSYLTAKARLLKALRKDNDISNIAHIYGYDLHRRCLIKRIALKKTILDDGFWKFKNGMDNNLIFDIDNELQYANVSMTETICNWLTKRVYIKKIKIEDFHTCYPIIGNMVKTFLTSEFPNLLNVSMYTIEATECNDTLMPLYYQYNWTDMTDVKVEEMLFTNSKHDMNGPIVMMIPIVETLDIDLTSLNGKRGPRKEVHISLQKGDIGLLSSTIKYRYQLPNNDVMVYNKNIILEFH